MTRLINIIEEWANQHKDRWALRQNRKFGIFDSTSHRIKIDFQINSSDPDKSTPDIIWVGCRGIAQVRTTTITFTNRIDLSRFDLLLEAADPEFFAKLEFAFIESGLLIPNFHP